MSEIQPQLSTIMSLPPHPTATQDASMEADDEYTLVTDEFINRLFTKDYLAAEQASGDISQINDETYFTSLLQNDDLFSFPDRGFTLPSPQISAGPQTSHAMYYEADDTQPEAFRERVPEVHIGHNIDLSPANEPGLTGNYGNTYPIGSTPLDSTSSVTETSKENGLRGMLYRNEHYDLPSADSSSMPFVADPFPETSHESGLSSVFPGVVRGQDFDQATPKTFPNAQSVIPQAAGSMQTQFRGHPSVLSSFPMGDYSFASTSNTSGEHPPTGIFPSMHPNYAYMQSRNDLDKHMPLAELAVGFSASEVYQRNLNEPTSPSVEAKNLRMEPSGPTSGRYVTIPKKRTGGRKRGMTKEELARRKKARTSGVCIRCCKLKVQCSGGIPCTSCIANLNAVRWKQPCVKAEFFNIIEPGSFFGYASLYHEAILKRTESMPNSIVAIFMQFFSDDEVDLIIQGSFIFPARIWILPSNHGIFLLTKALLDSPTFPSKIPSSIKRKMIEGVRSISDFGTVLDMDVDKFNQIEQSQRAFEFGICPKYQFQLFKEGQMLKLENGSEHPDIVNVGDLMIWLAGRYMECAVFRKLQDLSNRENFGNTEQLHMYILSMLPYILIRPTLHLKSVEYLSLESDNEVVVSVKEKHSDRVARIRSALWVYTSIAVSKIPSWNNFWANLESQWPLLPKEFVTEGLRESLSDLDGIVRKKNDLFIEKIERLHTYFNDVKELGVQPDIDEQHTPEVNIQELYNTIQDLVTQNIDHIIEYMDDSISGGLLSAESPEQRLKLSARLFFVLASIDWKNCFTENHDTSTVLPSLYVCLMAVVRYRVTEVQIFNEAQNFVSMAIRYGNFDNQDEGIEEVLKAAAKHSSLGRQYIQKVHQGKRWTELSALTGAIEIILVLDPSETACLDRVFRISDISGIVILGSDDDFTRLKNILSTKCSGIAEICGRLRGLLQMIADALYYQKTDRNKTLSLATLIADKVAQVFGSPEDVSRLLKDEIMKQKNSVFASIPKIVLSLWDARSNSLKQSPNGLNEAQLSRVLQLLIFAMMSLLQVYLQYTSTQEDFSCESVRKHFIQAAEAGLHRSTYDLLAVGSKNEGHAGVTPQSDHSVAHWISKGIRGLLQFVDTLLESRYDREEHRRRLQHGEIEEILLEVFKSFEKAVVIAG